jgi:hypothetical protein
VHNAKRMLGLVLNLFRLSDKLCLYEFRNTELLLSTQDTRRRKQTKLKTQHRKLKICATRTPPKPGGGLGWLALPNSKT